jgi:hypothetical protein
MVRKRFIGYLACGVLLLGAWPVFAQDAADASGLQSVYMQYLKSEGYAPTIDSNGTDIDFKYQGGYYYISIDAKDPQYFCLVYPNFYELDSRSVRNDAAIAASHVSANKKVVKVWLTPDDKNVCISTEIYLKDPSDISAFLSRMLSAIASAREDFMKEMQ